MKTGTEVSAILCRPGGRVSETGAVGRWTRVALSLLLVLSHPALGAVIVVDEATCTLVDAITAANTDTAVGGCTAGSGADEIRLASDVILTAEDNDTDGPNGLPSVISQIAVEANGFSISRDSGAAGDFRIFHVDTTGSLTLTNGTISGGASIGLFDAYGGGIWNDGELYLVGSSVTGNEASNSLFEEGLGGGIFNTGTATLVGSTVTRNRASSGYSGSAGAGIHSNGTLTLVDSTVSNNSVSGLFGPVRSQRVPLDHFNPPGGGIFASGTVVLRNTTIANNFAHGEGAGLYLSGNSTTATLSNVTVSGNFSRLYYSGQGAGIKNRGVLTATHTTIVDNTSDSRYGYTASGLDNTGTATLINSIVANNRSGNCTGATVDGGNNFDNDGTCGGAPITSGVDFDPGLTDNGGPTQTHALLEGSAAIDAAGDCGLETDQRGFTRSDGACDSGSYEFGALPPLSLSITGSCPGEITISVTTPEPDQSAVLFVGPGEGSSVVATGPCAGTKLGIASARRLRSLRTDEKGEVSLVQAVPSSWCGRVLQAVAAGCSTSNVAQIP